MTSYNAVKLFNEIERVAKSELSVTEGLLRIIQFCGTTRPHPDWSALRTLDVESDLRRLQQWLETIMRTTPPPAPITGLWFGLFNPTVRGRVTADVHLIGAPYDATDPDWLFRERWGKGTPDSGSTVLDSIYQVAYGHEDGLGNDAEYPLALAYAALAVRHLARLMGPTLLGNATQRVLNVGFDSGDFLCIGAIQKDGLIFSENSEVMAPWKGG
ncbi:hypothetical protein FJV41_15255 [Myxococcus llanfairpwllgwyngyllgogerychwyrndrobwllllantysiliogogogochensis]|uniref:Uncharacterized protein n=1 Tax=Myxococcus llanfairpwllgwyngyllgogerychwyrndrobwllllantysiliogogogochensis TaxID=2590453 RepID=A0A540X340_9BACT|nr:hypothetical protein [Myxococcus llanfairpwllgwyngyllgogerychwyrndrobwllllantysiliogogogochensis]TQF15104.1 hypothetical protein FJV41_15255 [Myxococcus llanfairpwllgwyngyllgogerychwyrndrobwllllantysiliogogogochensis]